MIFLLPPSFGSFLPLQFISTVWPRSCTEVEKVLHTRFLSPRYSFDCSYLSTVLLTPPRFAAFAQDMSLSGWKRQSINDLFVYGSGCSDVSNDSLLCLRAKAGSLLDRAMYISHIAKSGHP